MDTSLGMAPIRPEDGKEQGSATAVGPAGRSSQAGHPDLRREVAQTILTEQAMIGTLVTEAASQVTKDIVARENRRQKIISLVLAILAIVGGPGIYATIQSLARTTVEDSLERQQENVRLMVADETRGQVSERIGELREEIRDQAIYQQLTYMAFSLDFKTSFSSTERDLVMSLLGQAAASETLRARADFPVILEKLIDSFSSAAQDAHIDDLYALLSHEILKINGACQTLAQHYGRRLLHAEATKADRVEDLRQTFGMLEENARREDYVEVSLPFRMALDLRTVGDDLQARMDGHFRQLENLDPSEISFALVLLFRYREQEYYQGKADETTVAVTSSFSDYFDRYGAELARLAHRDDVLPWLERRLNDLPAPLAPALAIWLHSVRPGAA